MIDICKYICKYLLNCVGSKSKSYENRPNFEFLKVLPTNKIDMYRMGIKQNREYLYYSNGLLKYLTLINFIKLILCI